MCNAHPTDFSLVDLSVAILSLHQESPLPGHEVDPDTVEFDSPGISSQYRKVLAPIIHEHRREVAQIICWQGRHDLSTVGILKYLEDRNIVLDAVQQSTYVAAADA